MNNTFYGGEDFPLDSVKFVKSQNLNVMDFYIVHSYYNFEI